MNKTNIQWTNYTTNPIKFRDADGKVVWGCVRASEGCLHCYADALAHRYHKGDFTASAMAKLTPFVDEAELRAILRSKAPAGSRVFLGDMTDVFGPWVTDEMLDRVFATMALRPGLTFQVLTKRPERMREYVNHTYHTLDYAVTTRVVNAMDDLVPAAAPAPAKLPWPLPNVWLGTSVENQRWADVRIPELLATPAAVRFISAEPLLGPVHLMHHWLPNPNLGGPLLAWAICGGESGPGARPCDLAWIRGIVQQCQAAGVPAFVKQDSGAKPGQWGRIPEELRIREFPHA